MKNKKIVVGIIGYGTMGKFYEDILTKYFANIKIKGICDTDSNRLKDSPNKKTGINFTTSYKDIIEDPMINTVLICAPSNMHTDLIIACSKSGKNIFCEKQIGDDPVKVKTALEIVRDNKIKLQIGFMRRFDNNYKLIKKRIDGNKLGRQYIIIVTSRDPSIPAIEYIKSASGIFNDMTSHDFDIIRFLTSSEVEEIFVIGKVLIEPEISKYDDYDIAVLTLKLRNGAIGIINNCMKTTYGYDQRVEIIGSKSCIKVDNIIPNQIQYFSKDGIRMDKLFNNKNYFFIERYYEAYREQLHYFFNAIKEDKEPVVNGLDGLINVLIANAARKSAKENTPVKIDYSICDF